MVRITVEFESKNNPPLLLAYFAQELVFLNPRMTIITELIAKLNTKLQRSSFRCNIRGCHFVLFLSTGYSQTPTDTHALFFAPCFVISLNKEKREDEKEEEEEGRKLLTDVAECEDGTKEETQK